MKTTCILLPSVIAVAYAQANKDAFDWTSIEPSTSLNWVSCYSSNTQCARFAVPYNYSDPSAGTAAIAVIRIPSPLAGSAQYKGPVLFNPGGPGDSGIDFLLEAGALLSGQVLGPEFDFVSFDPRGVARSTPKIAFFSSDLQRAQWDFGPKATSPEAFPDAIPQQWARAQVLGKLAWDSNMAQGGWLSHVTTDNVARDMLALTQAHGQQKVRYWGISYGTTIGATFASMFPDKVERLIIDGVMGVEGYYDTDWSWASTDTEKTLQLFIDGCHSAGPSRCAFYADSSDAIKNRINALYAKIQAQPVPVYDPATPSPITGSAPTYGTYTYPDLKNSILIALYNPYTNGNFPSLAQGLVDLEKGNATLLYEKYNFAQQSEVLLSIACADGKWVFDDAKALQKYYDGFKGISSFAGPGAQARIGCSGWQIHPSGHFQGPIGGNTSFPLLVIGNTADPVTPLATAERATKLFPGSVLLTQDSGGHTSFALINPCTLGHVAAYFQNGTLPATGTVCKTQGDMFPDPNAANGNSTTKRDVLKGVALAWK